jgi:hypothetical protein
MPSAIDPEKPAKPVAKPAAAKPTALKTAPRPAAVPKPARAAAADDDHDGPSVGTSLLRQTPAWAVSMLVHIVALLAMALIVTAPPKKEAVVSIVSSATEPEEVVKEFEDPTAEPPPVENTPPVADVTVTTDVVVESTAVADATNVDAAPLAVEHVDFGDITAPVSGMLSLIGGPGGQGGPGGGLGGRKHGSTLAPPETQEAVDRALKWFINHQMPDGGWSFDLKACPSCQGRCSHGANGGSAKDRCAATAMVLLPFYGRGYTHKDGPYKKELEAGIAFLAGLSVQGEGRCYDPASGGSMYSQGLAGIALSEAYAMTQDGRLQSPAQMALYFIEQAQDPVGGGWRYQPRQPGDTSAVGWQLMALKSGNMAYLNVNPATVKNAIKFLDSVEEDSGAYYGYLKPGRGSGTTAVGLLCRMYLGWKKDHPALQRGVEFLAKTGPTKDLYFSYYATQIMHHMEGDAWQAWNAKMKKMLLENQAKEGHEAGSWFKNVEGGHGAHSAGRLYCTSLATMMLEVYYRHLPIYRGQATEDEFRE